MSTPISLRRMLEWTRTSSSGLAAYLEKYPLRKMQIGSGTNVLEGWFNTDIMPAPPDVFFLDTTKRFPFEEQTFDYVFSEHHIEHLTYQEGLATLQECYRMLRPGGKIRIATPDLEALLGLYTERPDALQQRYMRFITDMFLPNVGGYNPVFVINNAFYNWGHQFLYNQATLRKALEDIGFVAITVAIPGESNDEQLCGIERHGRFIGSEEMNRFETMVLEGQRP